MYQDRQHDADRFHTNVNHTILYFVYIVKLRYDFSVNIKAVIIFLSTMIATFSWMFIGDRITKKIRKNYLQAIIQQDIAYFDTVSAGEITTRITGDATLIQEGISEKVVIVITSLATFISALIIAFVKNWKLAIISIYIIPLLSVGMRWTGKVLGKCTRVALAHYSAGGALAEEAFANIRSVQAFGMQKELSAIFNTHLALAFDEGKKKSIALGFLMAVTWLVIYSGYALAFWYGAHMLVRGEISAGIIFNVFYAVNLASMSLGQITPSISAISSATAAGKRIFEVIDQNASKPLDNVGKTLPKAHGKIEFQNISFSYPARPNITVLDNFSLKIPAGRITALVGASGSGKSTVFNLVERFYDQYQGRILFDGHDIKCLNLKWFRQQISLVSQEPSLFSTTIFENICRGLIGCKYENASVQIRRQLVHDACEEANADEFIRSLPKGYETQVGERGILLSGGQKQRIAIARAIVSRPKVLLLDEATSELDTPSEGIVQDALDRAAKRRTTIVIAHRLSTIKNADCIIVISAGRIVEQGTHIELMNRKDQYWKLVEAQRLRAQLDQIGGTDDPNNIKDVMAACFKGSSMKKTIASNAQSCVQPGNLDRQYSAFHLFYRIMCFNKPEKFLLAIGFIATAVCGNLIIAQAQILAHFIEVLSHGASETRQLLDRANFLAILWLIVAVIAFLCYFLVGFIFEYCAEKITLRVRERVFSKLVHSDIEFFDRDENDSGILTIVAWKLALLVMSTILVLVSAGYFRINVLKTFRTSVQKAYQKSARLACEAAANIRTVQSLTWEIPLLKEYSQSLSSPSRSLVNAYIKSSIFYACSQSSLFLCNALAFWWGATLIRRGQVGLTDFYISLIAIVFGARAAGHMASLLPDINRAVTSASNIFRLLDNPSLIGTNTGNRRPLVKSGAISLKDVCFQYPSRPDISILRGFSLDVKPGEFVALVGQSGCGKSTVISLIERFYDPLSGIVAVDEVNIKEVELENYRSHISLVSQEPTLYQGSIIFFWVLLEGSVRFNVTIGINREVTDDEVIAACKDANIHEFIESLPQGYETICGYKGNLMSGGQKQRIVIARALLRKPMILLLDEATSALDSASEVSINQALETAAKGRTTIAIAHRLSTVQNADVIYFMERGKLVEQGTHNELLVLRGKYFEMVQMQQFQKEI
ncbi:Leptomycin B resistance protein pmd1 [Neolecta irregularis DAH-3]|uniref:Leptomycin B resistance protein pmd1 n=1 Tax=Neolecta irregularis (strain DAH-3) TaxID=1198029 RepID=A0A1U7LRM1_NEOID|nr:Leptomycin B resistance protein pmd1 [Neolecta irregularis DAH-3]|eukprot:OLL25315.1 Leptomycin B resistance protein pmd1 [Neolecta irregularis DAH-3]